jgi:regulatory protein
MPPAGPPNEAALYDTAVCALSRRAHSIGEIRRLLQRRKPAPEAVETVVARLRSSGYLDDAEFARIFVASRIENESHGPRRMERDLAVRFVHPDVARQAIESAYESVDERELLREHLRRKVRLTKAPAKPTAIVSLYRRLLRAGFASATIAGELQGLFATLPSGNRRGKKPTDDSAEVREDLQEKWREWMEALTDLPEMDENSDHEAD